MQRNKSECVGVVVVGVVVVGVVGGVGVVVDVAAGNIKPLTGF